MQLGKQSISRHSDAVKKSIVSVTVAVTVAVTVVVIALIISGAQPVAAQEDVQAKEYRLPLDVNDESMIAANENAGDIPPLQIKNTEGDFMITKLDDKTGLRVLPDKSADVPGKAIELVWSIPLTSTKPQLVPGSTVELNVLARGYSPPEGARLFIEENNGEIAGSSSTIITDVVWTGYVVSRVLADDATEVTVGFEWKPTDNNAWIEFRDFTLAFFAPSGESTDVSPTDVPTEAPLAPTEANAPATSNVAIADTGDGPLIVVTSTPTPPNVFAAATQVAATQTLQASNGTSTPTPINMVTATPTREPIIVTSTPTPGNDATATYISVEATAIAATTGTATPLPAGLSIVTATPTQDKSVVVAAKPATTKAPTAKPAAKATNTPRPTKTPTPVFVPVDQLIFPTPTPTHAYPDSLKGKILFLSPYLARNSRTPQAFAINPDGTGLALLSSREFYDRAKELDSYSADKRFYFYNQRESLGANNALIQVYYNDAEYNSTGHQLTYFGDGVAWGPAVSPVDSRVVALTSSVTENDEIWVTKRDEWPAVQITHNDWEWDRSPSFSPDGRQIALESNRVGGTRQVWVMNLDGSDAYQVTNFPFEAWEPVWVKYTD